MITRRTEKNTNKKRIETIREREERGNDPVRHGNRKKTQTRKGSKQHVKREEMIRNDMVKRRIDKYDRTEKNTNTSTNKIATPIIRMQVLQTDPVQYYTYGTIMIRMLGTVPV